MGIDLMINTKSTLSIRLAVWFLILSILPLAVVTIFVMEDMEAGLDNLNLYHQRNQTELFATILSRFPQGQAESIVKNAFDIKDTRFIVNSKGQYFFHTDKKKIGLFATDDYSQGVVHQVLSTKSGAILEIGTEQVIGFAPIPNRDQIVAIVTDSTPATSILSAIRNSSQVKLAVSLAILSVSAGIIIWLIVGRPVKQLTKAADKVSQGILDVRVDPAETADELQILAKTFNHMTAQLRELINNFEQKVAELEMAEKAIRDNEKKYRELVENANSIILKWAKNGQIIFLNEYGLKFFGYRQDEIVGQSVFSTIVPATEDSGRNLNELMRGIFENTAKYQQNQNENIRKDGSRVWVAWTNKPIVSDTGEVTGMLSVGTDITKQIHAELKLKESEAKYRKLFEKSTDAVFIAEKSTGRYLMANAAAEKLTGYTVSELKKMSSHDLTFEGAKRRLKSIDSLDTGIGLGEVVYIRPDGSERVANLNIVPLDDDNVFGIAQDITERKRAEEEKAIIEAQYRQAQKVDAIGRLAGGVAHDLNNMLSPILGYSEMLLDDLDPEDDRIQIIKEISKAAIRARNLVRQLLAFSRKQTFEIKPVNLNKTIEDIKTLLHRTIREDIELSFKLSPEIGSVKADISQIDQVILNLTVNAAEAMPEGGNIYINTSPAILDKSYAITHPGVKPGEYTRLEVTDTGCGMDEETADKIFEPFFSTKGDHGTGLGLSTVYGIVKQHGGNIWVYSELGKGTTFKVYFPVDNEAPIETKNDKRISADLRGTETILLVEDNEQVRHLAEKILEKQGYTIILASNGTEALSILESLNESVDILLTDVVMPDMNGKDLYLKVRETCPDIKVLFMSGYSGDVITDRGVLEEGVQFIQKPFSVHGLSNKVWEALNQDLQVLDESSQ